MAYLCARLHQHLLQAIAGQWLVEHVYCPLARMLVLAATTLLLFPAMVSVDYSEIGPLFADRQYLTDMVNILMVSGLLISFFPLINHPGIGLPLLGCIATAILIKRWGDVHSITGFSLMPGTSTVIKLLLLIGVAFIAGRWLINQLSVHIDQTYMVTGSRVIVTDVVYLIVQIPVILAYAHALLLANGLAAQR
jgi:hypothetical protein